MRITLLTVDLHQTAKSHGRKVIIKILQTGLERILEPLSMVSENRFTVCSEMRMWKRHLVIVLNCCNISERNHMSGVNHDRTFLLFVQYLSTYDIVFALRCGKRQLDTNIGKVYLEANQAH